MFVLSLSSYLEKVIPTKTIFVTINRHGIPLSFSSHNVPFVRLRTSLQYSCIIVCYDLFSYLRESLHHVTYSLNVPNSITFLEEHSYLDKSQIYSIIYLVILSQVIQSSICHWECTNGNHLCSNWYSYLEK